MPGVRLGNDRVNICIKDYAFDSWCSFFPFLASCGIVSEQSLYLVQVLMNCLLSSAPPVATTLKIFFLDVLFHCIFDCAAECFLEQPMLVERGDYLCDQWYV